MNTWTKTVLCAVLASGVTLSHAQTKPESLDRAFPHYSDKNRGWHWKEIMPEPVEPEPEPQPPVAPAPAPTPAQKPETDPEGPKPLSAEWIRQNMPKYLDAAIDNPTPQNVSNYLYLQKFSVDSADRFSQIFKRVSMADPNLDENNVRPVWAGATASIDRTAAENRKKVLKQMSQTTGIWFFYRSDCEPCHIQAPVLAAFAQQYGFTIFPVAVDGRPMPGGPFKKFVPDQGQAAKLGVTSTPTLLLAKPPATFIRISEGMLSMPEMEDRIIELATNEGLLNEEQYQTTRTDKKNLLPPTSEVTNLSSEAAKDPNAVREHLRSLITKRKP